MYPDGCVNGIEYKDIQYINDKDWHSLMSICRSFNYIIEKKDIPTPQKIKTTSIQEHHRLTILTHKTRCGMLYLMIYNCPNLSDRIFKKD